MHKVSPPLHVIACWSPYQFPANRRVCNEIGTVITPKAALIQAFDRNRAGLAAFRGSRQCTSRELGPRVNWHAICSVHDVHQQMAVMFKITHNTVHRFSLAEILLMVAINQMEAKRKADPAK